MSANYSNSLSLVRTVLGWKWVHTGWGFAVILPLWLVVGGALAMVTAWVLVYLLNLVGVPLDRVDDTILRTAFSTAIYALTLGYVIGLPHIFHRRISKEEIGLTRLPTWTDMALAPAGLVVSFIAAGLLAYVASLLFSGFNAEQVQDVGFNRLSQSYEYTLAFVSLIVVAPVVEEILFRGFLYGKLRRRMPIWVAIVIVSALFGLVHGQWNVALNVFALSVVLCGLREITGGIWAGIILHMLKNSVAFYVVFISQIV